MRTNIDIDDGLMNDALKATGLKTKKDAVELGLKTLVKLHKQAELYRVFRRAPSLSQAAMARPSIC